MVSSLRCVAAYKTYGSQVRCAGALHRTGYVMKFRRYIVKLRRCVNVNHKWIAA